MNDLQSILAQLHDVHSPPAISIWPPAPGWWILATLLLIALSYAWWRCLPWLRSLAYRRAALKILQELCASTRDTSSLLSGINTILRRVARCAYPNSHVASLTAGQWLRFLDRSARMRGFTHGAGKVLALEPYRPQPKVRTEELYRLVKQWVKRHRVGRNVDPLADR